MRMRAGGSAESFNSGDDDKVTCLVKPPNIEITNGVSFWHPSGAFRLTGGRIKP